MYHIGGIVREATQVPGRDLVVGAELLGVQPLPLVAGVQQPPGVLGVVGLVEDDLPGKPQVVDAGCEGEDRETDGHQPSGQPVPELPVFKSLDSRHHADSLRGSATRCSVAKADWGAGEAGQ